MAAGNSAMIMETGSGWSRGLNNLLRAEVGQWFGTRRWWTQIIIWGASINLIFLITSLNAREAGVEGTMIFNIFLGLVGPIAVTIMMQNVVGGERRAGTAAWILSKPVSRHAFILSKLIGNTLGIAVTMVIAQGIIAYLISGVVLDQWLAVPGFVAGLAAQMANIWFYLTLTLMLGAIYEHPAPVIGLPMAFLFAQQFLVGMLPQISPVLASALPWTIVIPIDGQNGTSVANALMMGQPVPTLLPIYVALISSVIFVAVALWVFQRQEL